jgi:uncharacterized membrane protein HdeD (DUF308 family)
MARTPPIPMCPMAETCGRMMNGRRMAVAPLFMGAIFILLGIAIILEPRIIIWALAAMLIFMGIMMLVMAGFMRKMSERNQTTSNSMG